MVSLFLNTNIFDEIYYLHFLSVPLNTVPKIIPKFLSIFVIDFHSITLNFTCLLLKKECSDPTPLPFHKQSGHGEKYDTLF